LARVYVVEGWVADGACADAKLAGRKASAESTTARAAYLIIDLLEVAMTNGFVLVGHFELGFMTVNGRR